MSVELNAGIAPFPPEKIEEQANHNFKVAEYLVKHRRDVSANDWILTIAYYSVIHYFEHFLNVSKPILSFKGKGLR